MNRSTCRTCLQPEAVLAIAGERSSQYACRHCGEVFELDHPPTVCRTMARPQAISLPAVYGVPGIMAVRATNAH